MSIKVALELQPCYGQRSGIGTYTYELAKRLTETEDLLFCGNLFNFRMRNNNGQALSGIRFPVHCNSSMPYGVYRRIWDLIPLNYSMMFPAEADITHFFNYVVPPGVKGKVINSIYDLVYIRYPETMDKKNLSRIEKGLKDSLERSDAVVTDSLFVKGEIIQYFGLEPDRVHVIYPSASVSDTNVKTSYLAEKWNIKEPYVLFLGNIEPRKNLIRLINAYGRVRAEIPQPVQLVLAGGKGWRSDGIYGAAKASGYSEDIIFTGYVSADEKSALYRNAEVFVFPSIYEGFGIPVLEAMECGTPVVCSNASSLPEVTGDSAGLVDPFSEADIAEKLIEIITDRDKAGRMSALGKKRNQLFNWERSAKELMQLYKSMG